MDKKLYKKVGELADKWKDYPNFIDKGDPNNRTALIEKNLRMAVELALKNKGKGLTEDELLSSAFFGLCNAWDKYKDDNPKFVRNILLGALTEETTYDEFVALITENASYGKVLNALKKADVNTPAKMVEFIDKYFPRPKFSSVAYFWIVAQIKADIKLLANDTITVDERIRVPETPEEVDEYDKLFYGISAEDEMMLNMRNGIGTDTTTYDSIARYFNITPAEVKTRILDTTERIRENITKYNLNIDLFL